MNLTPKEEVHQTIEQWANQLEAEIPVLLKKYEKLDLDPALKPEDLLREVLKFLWLVAQSKTTLTPAHRVDLGWHEFILFTRAYAHFCTEKLGRFVHHTPDENKGANRNRFSQTIYKYVSTFGEPPALIWGADAHQEWQDLNCGACSTL